MQFKTRLDRVARAWLSEEKDMLREPKTILFIGLGIALLANTLLAAQYFGLWHDDGWGVLLSDRKLYASWFGSIYSRHGLTDMLLRDVMSQVSPYSARVLLIVIGVLPAIAFSALYLTKRSPFSAAVCVAIATMPFLIPTIPDIPLGLNLGYIVFDFAIVFALLKYWPTRDSSLLHCYVVMPIAVLYGVSEGMVSIAFLAPVLVGAGIYRLRTDGLKSLAVLVATFVAFGKVIFEEISLSRASAELGNVRNITKNLMELLDLAFPVLLPAFLVFLVIGFITAIIAALIGFFRADTRGEGLIVALGLAIMPLLVYTLFQDFYSPRYAFASLFGLYALTAFGIAVPIWILGRWRAKKDDRETSAVLREFGALAVTTTLSIAVMCGAGFKKSQAKQTEVVRDTTFFEGVKRDLFVPPSKALEFENVHQFIIVLGIGTYRTQMPRTSGILRLLTGDELAIGAIARHDSCGNPFSEGIAFDGRLSGMISDQPIAVIGRGGAYKRRYDVPYLLAVDLKSAGEAFKDQNWVLYSVDDFRVSVETQGLGASELSSFMGERNIETADIALNCKVKPS